MKSISCRPARDRRRPRLAPNRLGPDPSVDHDARPSRKPHRPPRVQGRRAHDGDRREGARHPRLHPRPERLQQQLPRRVGLCHRQGLPEHRGRGQHDRHLLRADGRQVAVPHGQRRHRLFPRRPEPDEGPAGGRAAAGQRRHLQRHVVQLDHRRRLPRSRSRRRRQVPAPAAGLRRSACRRAASSSPGRRRTACSTRFARSS